VSLRFWKKKPVDRMTPVDTEVLVSLRAARTLFRMHLGASAALISAAVISAASLVAAVSLLQFNSVDHVMRLQGVLQAVDQATPISHSTGGVVSGVFVTNGEIVEEGQVLMALDASDIESELNNAQRAVAGLMLQSLCLRAEQSGQTTVEVPAELRIAVGRLNQIQKMQRALRDCKTELEVMKLEKLRKRSEMAALQDQIILNERLSKTAQSLRGRLHQLGQSTVDRELSDALNLQNLVETLRYSLRLSELQKEMAAKKITDQTQALMGNKELMQKLDRIIDALAAAEAKLARLDKIKNNRFVYASIRGRVQRLRIKSGGKRIARNAHLLEIAPLTTDFEVLATAQVADLPYLSVGLKVTVSLSSGLPRPIQVPAVIAKISKASENSRTLTISIKREDLNKRDLLIGDRSLNGLGERSEALISVRAKNALQTLGGILWDNIAGRGV